MIDLPWVTAESGLPKGAASAPGGLTRSKKRANRGEVPRGPRGGPGLNPRGQHTPDMTVRRGQK